MARSPQQPNAGYRGRLAPSPTGYLHVGHAHTFFTAFERAREAGGALVMRMEDLDAQRSKAAYAEAAYEDLHWLGIDWPEGPFLQSERSALYLDAWRRLARGGFLFRCVCSRKDLEAAAAAPHEGAGNAEPLDDEPIYPGTCRCSVGTVAESPEGANWRFRVLDGEAIEFNDANLGPQSFVAGVDFGDFVVWRRDGMPSYQLACVADDAEMRITEVVRGADLLKSTARQLLLYRALGLTPPAWFHTRLVVDHKGRRLAKRHDALSIRALRERGLTPQTILAADMPLV